MGRHRKQSKKHYYGNGKHRVVTPKRNLTAVRRTAIAFPIALSMALYPAAVGDGDGTYVWSPAIVRPNIATAGEVIPETSDGNDDGNVDVHLPGDD